MANENPTWGYTRIRGGLKHVGHDIARNTIKAIPEGHGIEPAPERRTKTPWRDGPAIRRTLLSAPPHFRHESHEAYAEQENGSRFRRGTCEVVTKAEWMI